MQKTHTAIVLISKYTRKNIYKFFKEFRKNDVHYIIRDFVDYPLRAPRYRVVLEICEKDNIRNCCRLANLYELAFFALKNPEFALHHGVIEGFDEYLESAGKEMEISLTVPYIGYSGGRAFLSVDRSDRVTNARYKLVVTSIRKMVL